MRNILILGLAMALTLSPAFSFAAVPKSAVVIAFTAPWCGQCKKDKPALKVVAKARKVVVVDVDAHPEYAEKYKVTSLPLYLIVVGKKPVLVTQHIEKVIESLK